MAEFFRARLAEEKRYQTNRLPFRRKFFMEECRYDSHAGTLRPLESEKIVNIDVGKCHSRVITEQTFQYSGGEKTIRLSYDLQVTGGDWLIHDVQTQIACFVCGGRGDGNCLYCKGKQWLNPADIRSKQECSDSWSVAGVNP